MKAALFVYVWPEPRSSAAGVRTHELARILISAGYEVEAFSPCAENEAMREWEALGVRCRPCPANESSVESFLACEQPALVIYDRFIMEEQFGWRLRQLWPAALHLIDTQDLHAVRRARERFARREGVAGAPEFPPEAEYGDDLLRELASLHRADACFVVSAWERNWLLERGLEPDRVLTLPFSAALEPATPAFGERSGFCFLGNFRHPPNLDGVLWFARELWPELRRALPGATLSLYGAYPPAQISQLDGKHGIRVPGPVRDHRSALKKHRVLVAPLRYGAGIKGKVLEAWACGTPVAGTRMAFEGLGADAQSSACPTPAELIARAVHLHEDEPAFHAAAGLGARTLQGAFSPEAVRKTLLDFLSGANQEKWRASLTGRMLRLQQNNATKYFSLWIEAKNKIPR